MSVFSFLCVLWDVSPSRRTLGGYAKGRSSYVPIKRQSFTCLEVPVLIKGSGTLSPRAHAVRWPSLASTHLYRHVFYDIITSGVGILFCEMPCEGWDNTVRNCVSSFPAIRAGGSTVQKGGPLWSCTAAKASTNTYISQKIFQLNFGVDNSRILQAHRVFSWFGVLKLSQKSSLCSSVSTCILGTDPSQDFWENLLTWHSFIGSEQSHLDLVTWLFLSAP